MIGIVSAGIGNISSIANMLKKKQVEFKICEEPEQLSDTAKIILPGVGAFDHGMEMLETKGWISALDECARIEKKPVLGICLGMQLMCRGSEEGEKKGLGWIDADVKRFDFTAPEKAKLKIPHMGWNTISLKKETPIFSDSKKEIRFYFVHSYHVVCDKEEDVWAEANYGDNFCCAFKHENIYGVQFHPEKSHRFGMNFMENFSKG